MTLDKQIVYKLYVKIVRVFLITNNNSKKSYNNDHGNEKSAGAKRSNRRFQLKTRRERFESVYAVSSSTRDRTMVGTIRSD